MIGFHKRVGFRVCYDRANGEWEMLCARGVTRGYCERIVKRRCCERVVNAPDNGRNDGYAEEREHSGDGGDSGSGQT